MRFLAQENGTIAASAVVAVLAFVLLANFTELSPWLVYAVVFTIGVLLSGADRRGRCRLSVFLPVARLLSGLSVASRPPRRRAADRPVNGTKPGFDSSPREMYSEPDLSSTPRNDLYPATFSYSLRYR